MKLSNQPNPYYKGEWIIKLPKNNRKVNDWLFEDYEEGYYENGQLKYKVNYKNGKEDGPFECYHKNGQLESIGVYKDGKLYNVYKEYDEDGKLVKSATYS